MKPFLHCAPLTSALIVLLLVSGCSHVSQTLSADKKESAAIKRTDKAWRGLVGKVADYNRELNYDLTLPPTTATQATALNLIKLQYNLTGNAPTPQAKLEAFVNGLLKDDASAHRLLAQAQDDDTKLKGDLQKATQDRDKAVAVSHALANQNATLADKYDGLIRDTWIVLAVLLAIYVLHVLYQWGVFGATVAAKAP